MRETIRLLCSQHIRIGNATGSLQSRFAPGDEVVPYELSRAFPSYDLCWSSGTWSKASERATVGLDQSRTRFILAAPTSK
jgi:hypothetical protein